VSVDAANRAGSKFGTAAVWRALSLLYALRTPAVAEKMLERSRASVRSIPTRTSAAIWVSASARVSRAGARSWRNVQRSTSLIARSLKYAAYSSGPSSAAARSDQWFSFVVPAPAREAVVIARAMTSASSHEEEALTGDHERRLAPSGIGSLAEGSNSHTSPSSMRAFIVARITSGLVDVLTTAPEAAISAGIMIALVLPLRGGPRIITALSDSAATHSPYSFSPRYAPPPTRRSPSRTRGGTHRPARQRCARRDRCARECPRARARDPREGIHAEREQDPQHQQGEHRADDPREYASRARSDHRAQRQAHTEHQHHREQAPEA
jgi:hypothetical protein